MSTTIAPSTSSAAKATTTSSTAVKAASVTATTGTTVASAVTPSAVVKLSVAAAAPTELDIGSIDFSTFKPTKALTISGTAAQIEANLDNLQKVAGKNMLTALKITDSSRQTVSFSVAQYKSDAQVMAKLAGAAAIAVKFDGNASSYTVTPNTNNTFTVKDNRTGGQGTTVLKGVNFIKFNDFSTFADTGNANINALLNGGTNRWWSSNNPASATTSSDMIAPGVFSLNPSGVKTQLTYSFLTNANDGSASDKNNFKTMNATQQQAVKDALSYLSSLINVSFVEDKANAGKADINFGTNDQSASQSAGYANLPNASGPHGVYLMLDNSAGNTNGNFSQGSYGWETLIHEIGHTMGLKHPGNYNAGGGGTPGPYLSSADDNRRMTVMSYKDPADSRNVTATPVPGGTQYSASAVNPSTYMSLDMQALQFLYGANKTPDSSTLEKFQISNFNDSYKGFETLWKPQGGTLDASSVTKANIFDLRDGAYSSVGIAPASTVSQLPAQIQKYQTYMGMNNVGLASGSTINTVKGGSGEDVIYAAANKSVTIDGGAGSDVVYLAGTAKDWQAGSNGVYTSLKDPTIKVTMNNVEKVKFYNTTSVALLHTALDLRA